MFRYLFVALALVSVVSAEKCWIPSLTAAMCPPRCPASKDSADWSQVAHGVIGWKGKNGCMCQYTNKKCCPAKCAYFSEARSGFCQKYEVKGKKKTYGMGCAVASDDLPDMPPPPTSRPSGKPSSGGGNTPASPTRRTNTCSAAQKASCNSYCAGFYRCNSDSNTFCWACDPCCL